jgi:hypothetical protein
MLSFIYTFTSKLPLLLVANMQVFHTAMMLFLLHNNASSNAASVTEILSTMAEMEDSNNKIHVLGRTLKKAQLQEGRLLDEIAEEKVDEKTEKADADVLAQVGIPCVYSNGTQGYKCVGEGVCDSGGNAVNIKCGSCIGDYSCYGLSKTDVGEQSCIGPANRNEGSCMNADNAMIGNNSCNGFKPCLSANNVKIGNDSCNGNESCQGTEDAVNVEIGNNSCNGGASCAQLVKTNVGEKSCNGYGSCLYAEYDKIGNNSCNGDNSCHDVNNVEIGNDSCNDRSCPPFPHYVEIGSTVA